MRFPNLFIYNNPPPRQVDMNLKSINYSDRGSRVSFLFFLFFGLPRPMAKVISWAELSFEEGRSRRELNEYQSLSCEPANDMSWLFLVRV